MGLVLGHAALRLLVHPDVANTFSGNVPRPYVRSPDFGIVQEAYQRISTISRHFLSVQLYVFCYKSLHQLDNPGRGIVWFGRPSLAWEQLVPQGVP